MCASSFLVVSCRLYTRSLSLPSLENQYETVYKGTNQLWLDPLELLDITSGFFFWQIKKIFCQDTKETVEIRLYI